MVYEGAVFTVHQWDQIGHDGRLRHFEKVTRPDTVAVIPIVKGRIVLAWEVQPGATPALGFIGGRVEPGEEILVAARRELAEEGGLASDSLVHWETVRPSMKVDWALHLLVAHHCTPVDVEKPADEMISLRYFDLAAFARVVTSSQFGAIVAAVPILRTLSSPGGLDALASRLSLPACTHLPQDHDNAP